MSWQFTQWGMKPEEVLDASAEPLEDASAETGFGPEASMESQLGQRALLRSAWSAGEFRFTVYFFFDERRNLSSVKLLLSDSSQSRALQLALIQRYGSAECEGHEYFDFLRWNTTSEVISFFGPISDEVPCNVVYVAINTWATARL